MALQSFLRRMGAEIARKLTKKEETAIEKVARLFRNRANNETFFYDVYIRTMSRSPIIKELLEINDLFDMTEAEVRKVQSLAKSVRQIIELAINLALNDNKKEMERICMLTGRRHIRYTKQKFEPSYWDEFIIAMVEELENDKKGKPLTSDELHTWQDFIRVIVDQMRTGYEIAYAAKPE